MSAKDNFCWVENLYVNVNYIKYIACQEDKCILTIANTMSVGGYGPVGDEKLEVKKKNESFYSHLLDLEKCLQIKLPIKKRSPAQINKCIRELAT